MTFTQYYGTLVYAIACMIAACITLAYYCRARWKWVIAPVFFVGLALLIAWAVGAWAMNADYSWLWYAPADMRAVIVGG